MRSINSHFASSLRKSLLFFWGGIWLCTLSASIALLHWTKMRELEGALRISGKTIDSALSASDWPMALDHLQSVSRTLGMYDLNISVSARNGSESPVMDPIGGRHFGFFPLCLTVDFGPDAQISGCRNLFGATEIGILSFLMIGMAFLGLSGLVAVRRSMQRFIDLITVNLEELTKKDRLDDSSGSQSGIVEVEKLRFRLAELLQSRSERDRLEANQVFAAQVAHDIRAPVAALKVLERDIVVLPDDTRFLFKSALDRIQAIAKSLLDSQRHFDAGADSGIPLQSTVPLVPIIEAILVESRIRFEGKNQIEFRSDFQAPESLLARVDVTDFSRVLSNLIGNACEAIKGPGTVTVTACKKNGDWVRIGIVDNGPGIPIEVLARLGERGVTFGKEGGSGLGLFHARTAVSSWGGSLEIKSNLGEGTLVWIHLPLARH